MLGEAQAAGGPRLLNQLVPLTSIRLFAALHIYLFHVFELHRLSRENPAMFRGMKLGLEVFDGLPAWVINVLNHGYCSTGLFFLLSGFVMTFLYADPAGCLTVRRGAFWFARLARIYPLHLAVLALIAPAILGAPTGLREPALLGIPISRAAYDAVGALLSVTLLQAWFPEFALSWNFPTWALSTVVFFYLVFPKLTGWLARLSWRNLWWLLAALPLVSLLPSIVYLAAGGSEAPFSFWNEFLLRCPLLWLPYFIMGMLLPRVGHFSRHGAAPAGDDSRSSPWAWGDLAALLLLVLCTFSDAQIGRALRLPAGVSPHLLLRHGLLAPAYLVIIYDLARQRGLLARVLGWRVFRVLGETSFSVFILQMPAMFVGAGLLSRLHVPSAARLGMLVALTLLAALCSTRFFERPVANWLKQRFARWQSRPAAGS